MDFTLSDKQILWRNRVKDFIEGHVRPRDAEYHAQQRSNEPWKVLPLIEELKAQAQQAHLWNLFMPPSAHQRVDRQFEFDSPQLTNLEYALCAEEMGRLNWSSEVFNCSAPDTGNMEVLHLYGSLEQKKRWLAPLMHGEIRSCFLMTEPDVASSDATNITTCIDRDGDDYVLNGRKWWSSGVGDPRCKLAIVMGKTDPSEVRYRQQSMILVPMDSPGLQVLRMLHVFGYDHAPHGHGEVLLQNLRVSRENILLGEGRGFEIAQGRLGPGRIHHCMRTIGMAEEALDKLVQRLSTRTAFGKKLAEQSIWQERVADARIDIEMTRLLCLKAADDLDRVGSKGAQAQIAMIKVAAPRTALRVLDDAIQAHGGAGVCEDFNLARDYAWARSLRLADGPDEVHRATIARMELRK
jgi:alkylation response protein AidB-like acyl-CoA dehydrogenase